MEGKFRIHSLRGALGLVNSDFAGFTNFCATDKELCKECIISNFTPSYPHKYKESNMARI